MEYRLYEITNMEIKKSNNGEILKDVDMEYHITIPEKIIDNKCFDIIYNIIKDEPLINERNCLIVKMDDDLNFLDCVYVFEPYTYFLENANFNFKTICEYYFKKLNK